MLHTVRPGEHIGLIASQYGITDHRQLWDLTENAALAALRPNPLLLATGDTLFIPDELPQTWDLTGNTSCEISLTVEKFELRVRCLDLNRRPESRSCFIKHSNGTVDMMANTDTIYHTPVKATERSAELAFPSSPGLSPKAEIELVIGGLDPVELPTGQRQRLNNLGYYAGFDEPIAENDPQLRWAIEEFQCDNGLKADGKCGPLTQVKLVEVHGV